MELVAAGMVDLGLTAAEVLALTPRHLHVLFEKQLEKERRINGPIMALTVLFANANRDRERQREPFTIEDFFPTEDPEKKQAIFMRQMREAIEARNNGHVPNDQDAVIVHFPIAHA